MVVHGKIRWTSIRCMVAYGGLAPITNRCEFEFENESHFQIQTSLRLEPDFEYGKQIQIQTQGGN